jgi:hypothetical protein
MRYVVVLEISDEMLDSLDTSDSIEGVCREVNTLMRIGWVERPYSENENGTVSFSMNVRPLSEVIAC